MYHTNSVLWQFDQPDVTFGIDRFLSSIHLICFGLASHICGFAGYLLRGVIGRITALDPALIGHDISVNSNR